MLDMQRMEEVIRQKPYVRDEHKGHQVEQVVRRKEMEIGIVQRPVYS